MPKAPLMRNEPPPVAQVGYDASRVEEYSARRYCPSDEDHDDDRSTLLGSASTNCNSRIKVPGKSYDTFPNTTESRKGKPKSWVSVVELFVVLFFFLVLLQPVISAFVRFVDPHEGVESREHRLEHKQWEAERKQEEQRRADERAKWAEEEEQMSARRRSRLDEWEEDRKMEMELRRRDREEWNRQRAAELEQRNKERQEWEEMKKDMDGWRYRHSGAVWTKPVAEKCAAYGIRQYSAILNNIPVDYDPHKTCEFTNITIQDRIHDHPKWCSDKENNEVRGYWWVDAGDSGELGCKPYWSAVSDMGCTGPGSGKRRFESSLHGLVRGEIWETLCATAPATIKGVYYDAPTYCDYRGGDTIWGLWDTDDQSC